ncbi:uncharacterized protein LOC131625578 [Vicia villosa]|uniref:uncharacterized protein LOC131625578 n=1 Tax=Vicia villosa TaxID=3911 RepID=UPI00273B50F2|nr:uncharacterized protein LOC131625578 [Vicia villosa]
MSRYSETSSRTKSPFVHGKCRCGLDAPLMTSWTDVNRRRCFYGCGMYEIQRYKRCNYFVWYDEEMCLRAKDMISTLIQRLNNAKVKIDEYELNMKIKYLKFSISIIIVFVLGLVSGCVLK